MEALAIVGEKKIHMLSKSAESGAKPPLPDLVPFVKTLVIVGQYRSIQMQTESAELRTKPQPPDLVPLANTLVLAGEQRSILVLTITVQV